MPKSCQRGGDAGELGDVVAALEASRQAIAKTSADAVRSRISAAKPLPVTAPIRAAISCTITSEKVMTRIIHSVA